MAYQLAGILGGAAAPLISVALLDRFGSSLAVSLYVVAMLALSAVCVFLAPETSRLDLHDVGRGLEREAEQGADRSGVTARG
jgi:hypothetical protein